MKYRQKEEVIKGESPYVEVTVTNDGTQARVKVQYSRSHERSGVRTTTWSTVDFSYLPIDEIACVARTMASALTTAQANHSNRLDELMRSVNRQLAV